MKKIIIYSAIAGLLLGFMIVFYLLNLEASPSLNQVERTHAYKQP